MQSLESWARRKPTGALVVFIQKGTAQRAAAKLMNVEYHNTLLRAAQKELARRQNGGK